MRTGQLTFSFIGPHPSEFTRPWMQFFAEYCYSDKFMPNKYKPIRQDLPRLFVEESEKQGRQGLQSGNINSGLCWVDSAQGESFWFNLYTFIDTEFNRRS